MCEKCREVFLTDYDAWVASEYCAELNILTAVARSGHPRADYNVVGEKSNFVRPW